MSEWLAWFRVLNTPQARAAQEGWSVLTASGCDPVILALHVIELHALRFRSPVTQALLRRAERAIQQLKEAQRTLRELEESQAGLLLDRPQGADAVNVRAASILPGWVKRRMRPKESLPETILRARLLRYVRSVAPAAKGRRPPRTYDVPLAALTCLVSGRASYPAEAQAQWRARNRALLGGGLPGVKRLTQPQI